MIQLSRPWYLTITTLWQQAEGFLRLREALKGLGTICPPHHMPMPEAIWHHTMFAILQINALPTGASAESYADEVLSMLVERAPDLVSGLSEALRVHTLEAYEVIAWDAATSVQLRSLDDSLEMFRSTARSVLVESVASLCHDLNSSSAAQEWGARSSQRLVTSLLNDPEKSSGGKASGSIARSPYLGETSVMRWRRPLAPIPIIVASAHLVCSDQALSNPGALADGLSIRPASPG